MYQIPGDCSGSHIDQVTIYIGVKVIPRNSSFRDLVCISLEPTCLVLGWIDGWVGRLGCLRQSPWMANADSRGNRSEEI